MLGILRRDEAREDRAIGMAPGNLQHLGQHPGQPRHEPFSRFGEQALHVDGDVNRRAVESNL